MASPAERLLIDLRTRLEESDSLTARMRQALREGDVPKIEALTSRLESLALECKLLVDEYRRAPSIDGPRVEAARAALEETASRLVRSSAISGGVLERMVTIRRGLLQLVSEATGGSYEASGRARELDPHGVRLRQQA